MHVPLQSLLESTLTSCCSTPAPFTPTPSTLSTKSPSFKYGFGHPPQDLFIVDLEDNCDTSDTETHIEEPPASLDLSFRCSFVCPFISLNRSQ